MGVHSCWFDFICFIFDLVCSVIFCYFVFFFLFCKVVPNGQPYSTDKTPMLHVLVHVITVGDARCDWFKVNLIKLIKVQRERKHSLGSSRSLSRDEQCREDQNMSYRCSVCLLNNSYNRRSTYFNVSEF